MLIHLLILNYNGRSLLAECLPSVLRAAGSSRHRCDVAVVDNESTDGSVEWLQERFPSVAVVRLPNRGLCSFNEVVPALPGPVAVLLNNDVKLDPGCIDPLVGPLLEPGPPATGRCFMTAPLCWRFDGSSYEGFKTALKWRWGLVQATALYRGHQEAIHHGGLTASAGAAMAVDCLKFMELGGFDPLYLPGRLEDLDLAFRAYQAGYHIRYVPEAVTYHLGAASFHAAFGADGCRRLALRNTLLFQWKNLRHPLHLARQCIGLPLRLALDVCRAPWVPRWRRWMFVHALWGAVGRLEQLRANGPRPKGTRSREREFFSRFAPRRMAANGEDQPRRARGAATPESAAGHALHLPFFLKRGSRAARL